MSTNDVPGANPVNKDVLALGAWAEHEDGSLIFVESVEGGRAIYSIFDVEQDPPVEYRDAMQEDAFKQQFSWRAPSKVKPDDKTAKKYTGKKADDDDDGGGVPNLRWTWHDKTPMPWERVMKNFPSGQRPTSAGDVLSAAERIARSLNLRAQAVRERHEEKPTIQRAATTIMQGLKEAIEALQR